MSDRYFSEIRLVLERFSKCVEDDLEEIRRQKVEMQSLKLDVQNMIAGKYVRDDKRVIISAPEIVIGNVDQDGMLKANAGASHVVIRANTIDIEGVGSGGSTSGGAITQRASVISQIALDPGIDGTEAVVGEKSQIINQARSISLCTSDDIGDFIDSPSVPNSGIILSSESELTIETIPSSETKTTKIKNRETELKKLKKELEGEMSAKKKAIDVMFDAMDICLAKQEKLPKDEAELYANLEEINMANKQFDTLKQAMPAFMSDYISTVSRLAETNRRLSNLDEARKAVVEAKKFKEETTGAVVNIKGEQINLLSTDGDGNMRTNKEASINMQAQTVSVTSLSEKEALMENGMLYVNTRTVEMSTADNIIKDEKNRENLAVGDIRFTTKNMSIEAVDYETKNDKEELKNQTKEGRLTVRMENMEFISVDRDGKSAGTMTVNAKAIQMKSMDVDKEKLTDKQMAAGSTMVMASEKMYAGIIDDKNRSKHVQLSGEKIGVIAKTTAEIQQEKAVVQLDGGNLAAGGGNTELYGALTVNGASKFKGDVTAGKATIDNIEAKTSFKSKSISDGVAVPGASSSAKLNAKIKEESAISH